MEANVLLRRYHVWLYEVDGKATSICAVTRTSRNIAAITKVYTPAEERKKGFAERLVSHVTRSYVVLVTLLPLRN